MRICQKKIVTHCLYNAIAISDRGKPKIQQRRCRPQWKLRFDGNQAVGDQSVEKRDGEIGRGKMVRMFDLVEVFEFADDGSGEGWLPQCVLIEIEPCHRLHNSAYLGLRSQYYGRRVTSSATWRCSPSLHRACQTGPLRFRARAGDRRCCRAGRMTSSNSPMWLITICNLKPKNPRRTGSACHQSSKYTMERNSRVVADPYRRRVGNRKSHLILITSNSGAIATAQRVNNSHTSDSSADWKIQHENIG